MGKDCKLCSKWQKHFYWSHMDLTKIRFCKKMDTSSMKKMDLPHDFHRNFRGRIGETVELKGPSSIVWQVSVVKSSEKFTFQSGWKDFIVANNIKAKDLLVFKYSGNSSFQVQIFDSSGCERISSVLAQKQGKELQELSDSSMKVLEGPDCNMHEDKITISDSLSDSEYSVDSAPVRMPRGRESEGAGTSKHSNGRGKFRAPSNDQIYFGQKIHLTPTQKRRVKLLSERIQPENDCFAILMKPAMVKGDFRIIIPVHFATKHLPQEIANVMLLYKGCTWPLSIGYKHNVYRVFASGWKKFVGDNHVEEGDLCLFEVTKSNKTVSFEVHISRK